MGRCQVHRLRNIVCKLPEKARPGIKKLLHKAFTAQTRKLGLWSKPKGLWQCMSRSIPKR